MYDSENRSDPFIEKQFCFSSKNNSSQQMRTRTNDIALLDSCILAFGILEVRLKALSLVLKKNKKKHYPWMDIVLYSLHQ
jgi:hypothetical protein